MPLNNAMIIFISYLFQFCFYAFCFACYCKKICIALNFIALCDFFIGRQEESTLKNRHAYMDTINRMHH